jgi:hypothetical protein
MFFTNGIGSHGNYIGSHGNYIGCHGNEKVGQISEK